MPDYNAVKQYRNLSVSTMTKEELLILLYDEALKHLRCASALFKDNKEDKAKESTAKCKDILNHLIRSLDRSYEISADLYKIYYFLNGEIIRSEIRRDASVLDKIIPLVKTLRESWSEASKRCRMKAE